MLLVVAQVYQPESTDALRAEGVDVYLEQDIFIKPHTIMVGNAALSARRFIIATGTRPIIPPIDGLDTIEYLTFEGIWDLGIYLAN